MLHLLTIGDVFINCLDEPKFAIAELLRFLGMTHGIRRYFSLILA
jgi:hypothetical protein